MQRVSATSLLILFSSLLLSARPGPGDQGAAKIPDKPIERGRYLVDVAGCNDCHTPKVMTPKGPVFHPTKILSGHQGEQKLPQIPSGLIAPGQWGALTNTDLTAWVGPWGVSFSANLTPDPATGIGGWTEGMFIATLRKGKHLGTGRDLLPPMPWQNFARMTDTDLKAVFAYLRSLPPVPNAVPQPLPPSSR
jgi:mono/diheme cytochrome c family protein